MMVKHGVTGTASTNFGAQGFWRGAVGDVAALLAEPFLLKSASSEKTLVAEECKPSQAARRQECFDCGLAGTTLDNVAP